MEKKLNQNNNLIENILNNILEDDNNPTALINCIDMALSLGKNNLHYTINTFHYLKNLIENNENYPIYDNQIKHFKTHMKFRMFDNFLYHHLINKVILPVEFKELIHYFQDEIFGNNVENDYIIERNDLYFYGNFIQATLFQNKDMFDYMNNIIKNEQIKFKTDKYFFNLLNNIIEDYLQSQTGITLGINTHNTFDNAPSIKIILNEYQKEKIKKQRVINQQPEKSLIQLLQNVIFNNQDHITKQPFYFKYKKQSIIYLDSILEICRKNFSSTLFMKILDIFQIDLTKGFTRNSVLFNYSSRQKYLSFVAICANSSEYNTNLIEKSGNWWLQNSMETTVQRNECFEFYNEDYSKQLLDKLYKDYIKSPFRDDLRIILFPHLDLYCIEQGLIKSTYFIEKLKNCVENKINLEFSNEFKYLSSLILALNENPNVVFHTLRLQEINNLLINDDKKNIEDILTSSKEKIINIICELENFFIQSSPYMNEKSFRVVLDNEPANASFDKNKQYSIPNTPKHMTNLIKINQEYINHVERNFSLFRINHILDNHPKFQLIQKIKKRKI